MKLLTFICALFASAIDFPRTLWRDPLLTRDFLHLRPGALDPAAKEGGESIDPASYEEVRRSYIRVWEKGRLGHDLRNVSHEWFAARPKLASKFFPFLALTGWVSAVLVWVV